MESFFVRRSALSQDILGRVWDNDKNVRSLAYSEAFQGIARSLSLDTPADPNTKQIRDMRLWLARCCSRATPLGNTAGVGWAVENDSELNVESCGHFADLDLSSESEASVLRWSPFVLEAGDKYWVEGIETSSEIHQREMRSVSRNTVSSAIAEVAAEPIPSRILVDELVSRFPQTAEKRIAATVREFISQGFLVDARSAQQIATVRASPKLATRDGLRFPREYISRGRAIHRALDFRGESRTQLALKRYTERFIERYGPDELVPIRDVVAPSGIGPFNPNPGNDADSESEMKLALEMGRFAECSVDGMVPLTDDWIARFRSASGWSLRSQEPAMPNDLLLEPLTNARQEPIWFAGATAVRQPGATVARFLERDNPATSALGTALESWWSRLGFRLADLDIVPANVDHLDLVARPEILSRKVTVAGCNVGLDSDLRDVLIGVHDMKLLAVDQRLRVPIMPISLSSYNLSQCHSAVELLAYLHIQHVRQVSSFDWGAVRNGRSILPRVTFGEEIISPAEWAIPNELDGAAGLGAWIESSRLPRYVVAQRFDRKVIIDSQSEAGRSYISELARRKGPGSLREAFVDGIEPLMTDEFGRRYVSEVVIPVYPPVELSTSKPLPRPTVRASDNDNSRAGAEWATLKIYCSFSMVAKLLCGELGRWLEDKIGSSSTVFFLRYRDPEPHVRIRLRLANGEGHNAARELFLLGSRFKQNFPTVARFVVEPYIPELRRFKALDGSSKELFDVFEADSAIALSALKLNASSKAARLLIQAALLWEYASIDRQLWNSNGPIDESDSMLLKATRKELSTVARAWNGRSSLLGFVYPQTQQQVQGLRSALNRYVDSREQLQRSELVSLGHLSMNRMGLVGSQESIAHNVLPMIAAASRSKQAFLKNH